MAKYILKRLMLMVAVVLLVSFCVYALMDLVPVDAAVAVLGEDATEEQLEAYRESHGLNDPVLIRYLRYMSGLLRMDLGVSYQTGESVWTLFISKFKYTLMLAGAAILFAVTVSVPLGILASVRHNSRWDALASAVAFVGLATPNFWVGLLLMIIFSVNLGWLPTTGAYSWKSIILPAITCGADAMASLTRITRSSMLDVLRQDYLRTARSKGVTERTVVWKHALGNAQIPIVTRIGSQIAGMLGGATVTERTFSWPGVGNYLVTAILQNDYEVVTGFMILNAIVMSVVLLAVDVIYTLVDPRVKAQYTKN